MIGIAVPIVLQMLLSNGLSLVDTMMIGRLGEAEVAAVGLANQMFFLAFLIFFGITSGTGIFVAQFWGDRDTAGIHHVVGLSLMGTLIFSIPFAIVSFASPEVLMRIFTPDENVVLIGSQYLKIVAPSYMMSGISTAYAMALRSIENPRIPLLVTAVSLVLNTILNFLLIFGLLFFPEMGVRGAAVATMISRGVEFVLMLLLVYGRKSPVAGSLKEYLGFDRRMAAHFLKTAGPVLGNEIAWSLGMVVYKIVFARMGTAVIAAANVTEAIQGLFFVILMGSGNTAAVLIGKKIGEGDAESSREYARNFLVQALLLGLGMGILMAACAPIAVLLLKMEPGTVRLVRRSLISLSVLMSVKSFNLHMIVGVLRSGGDTRFSFLAEFLGVWVMGVPAVILSGIVLKWNLPAVYLIAGVEEILKFVMTAIRFRSGKWINDLRRTKDQRNDELCPVGNR